MTDQVALAHSSCLLHHVRKMNCYSGDVCRMQGIDVGDRETQDGRRRSMHQTQSIIRHFRNGLYTWWQGETLVFSATAGLHVSLWFQEFRNVMLCCNLRHRTRPFVRVEKMYKAEVGRWVLFLINACQCDHVSGVLYRPRCVIMCLHGRADGREAGGRWTGASAGTATLVASWKSALDGERRKGSWVTSRSIWWRGYLDDARRL